MKFQKLGILGGGQLGKMLCQAAAKWHLPISVLDKSTDVSAYPYCHEFVIGDFNNFDDVVSFGKNVDILTIEIEHVNVEALEYLESIGKIIHPSPSALRIIKDKGLQKEFYSKHHFPTSDFILVEGVSDIIENYKNNKIKLPFVQKTRTAGYDGKGVFICKNESDFSRLIDVPSVIETYIPLKKEIAVIACKNKDGQIALFEPVEMAFHDDANLVEELLCPAAISEELKVKATQLASDLINAFNINGLLAIEFFVTKDDELLINEVAPRPHNSGHHTIESCFTSQFEQHLRGVYNLPLGNTQQFINAIMINLLGEEGFNGTPNYYNLEECMKIDGFNVHLYGKSQTKPFRKMGHVTIVNDDLEKAKEIADFVKSTLKVRT
ncbi:MAG: 5-(carboxyamino)imidazole ribonucleotide synthase [Saprospiraceae bacterium]|nr:5-(carboxyamino)imidazole ribonucleotide synthase [Saprospiraceae bacterium]